jgi:uncharacterized protein (DUF1501 family)
MLAIQQGTPGRNCQGMTRRTALKAGFLGLGGLSLPSILRARAEGTADSRDTACILIWLDGGPSQLETYDPKPEAPSEYRGPFAAIRTRVPGIQLCEMLPQHARHADKMVFVRSLHHDNGDHFAGAHWMLTGRFGSNAANLPQKYPSVGSYVSRVRGANKPGLPAYVGLPAAQSVYLFPGYMGAAYLGGAYNPFDVDREQKYLAGNSTIRIGTPRWLTQFNKAATDRLGDRKTLLSAFDGMRRGVDASGLADSLDRYQQQAMDMVLGGRARTAFDLDKEEPRTADRYGTGPWGRYTLMARRLVEAGVTFVTVDMPHWDDHSNIKVGHGYKLSPLDRAVGGLMQDLHDRSMLDRVLVVVMGEFGRTPRINTGQPGIPIPGRDHWGGAISAMLAGGGLRGGQVIGATNAKGEHPVKHALKPADLLATVYKVMGIDPKQSFKDHTGRPIPILDEGKPIEEAF